jgi:hypothetical protein
MDLPPWGSGLLFCIIADGAEKVKPGRLAIGADLGYTVEKEIIHIRRLPYVRTDDHKEQF